MGWAFEHLGEELSDAIVDRLRKRSRFKNAELNLEADEGISRMTEYGEGAPSCGVFQGRVTATDEAGNCHTFDITYVIKRATPSNGFDYQSYENEYECILRKIERG